MPAPTPFTMEDVVNGVLLAMRYAPGRDVQIHLQSGIIQDASMLYRSLMRRYVWRDFITLSPFTTNATTGAPVEDLTAVIGTFSDVARVYKKDQEPELPWAPALINPSIIRIPTIVPIGQPKVFAIYPVGATNNYFLWSRVIRDTDFELDDPVPFYKDLLIIGTAFQLSVKSGLNVELTGVLQKQFDALISLYRMDEVKAVYSTKPNRAGNPMTDWYVKDSSP
jgi:hypothetical protein